MPWKRCAPCCKPWMRWPGRAVGADYLRYEAAAAFDPALAVHQADGLLA